ncbi:MAG: putative metal-binding motif-containing protein, partial [Myxococcales bacterium]|nr:putative metal-binding motif-containing protein [Myxococcales bacterium]
MFQLLSLFACGSSSVAPVAVPERWDVVGTLPDEVDLSSLWDLPPGSVAVVGDPRTGEVAVVTREGESSRSVGSDFHVVSGAQCLDCGDPTCASSTRTLELVLEQDAGNDGEDLTVVRTGGFNFSGVVHTPAAFTSQVGQQVTIQSTGTLPTCAPFAYYFDVTGPDCDPWYEDADGDGFGAGAATIFCAAPGTGWSLRGDDCDDTAASAFPGGVETCNGID